MSKRTKYAFIAVIFAGLAMLTIPAFATNNKPPSQDQDQHQGQKQGQAQGQAQIAKGGTATASNDGNELTVGGDTSNVENNTSQVVLVPNNNTESCVRVWGIAFGRDSSSGAIGIPWRSAKCDYEQAADDAFAAGERDLGWFWKCQNKNLYKRFKDRNESADSAIDQCHARMLATTSTNDLVQKLQQQLDAADSHIQLLKGHEEVCDESLSRCEDRLYEGK